MHDTVNRPVRSRFHNLGDGVIEPGGDGVNLRGVEGRMLLARGHGGAIARDDSGRATQGPRRNLGLHDDILVLRMALGRETGASHKLRDERIGRVAKEGYKRAVEYVCVFLDETAYVVGATAGEVVDTEDVP